MQIGLAVVAIPGLIMLSACAASRTEEGWRAEQVAVPETEEGTADAKPAAAPFLFREAKRPCGFPPPGPVGTVIVKDYPAYRLARTQAGETDHATGPNQMFGPLFNHIRRNDIAMTAPVEMEYAKTSLTSTDAGSVAGTNALTSMGFLYAEPFLGSTGPDPSDSRVVVEDIPAMTVVSVSLRGNYTPRNFAAGADVLRDWFSTRSDQFRVAGSPRYLAYNSPFVPGFFKLGEVQIPVERIAAEE